MPKVSVYLSDDLYREARAHDLSISAVTQRALEAELHRSKNAEWIAEMRARAVVPRADVDVERLLDDVRAEFGQ